MSKAANPIFGVRDVINNAAHIKKIWQQLLGSNWCNSLMISKADAELSSCSDRHNSVFVRSRLWHPYSRFKTIKIIINIHKTPNMY